MKFEYYLLLIGGLSIVSIACGAFGLYQYYKRERRRKRQMHKIPTFRELYDDNKY